MFIICPLSKCASPEKCDRVSDVRRIQIGTYVLTFQVRGLYFEDSSSDLQ